MAIKKDYWCLKEEAHCTVYADVETSQNTKQHVSKDKKIMQFRRINCPFQKFWTIVLTDNSFANIKKVV